jgi:hypothetical protein
MLSHERTFGRDRARAGVIVTAVCTAWPAVFSLVFACAEPGKPNPQYPRSEAICQYVGLESVESQQRSDMDSLSFVATYRFREPHTPATESPLGVKFQVNRSRVAELRSHLESQPEVVCAPDHDAHYHVRVKPLPEPPTTIAEPAPTPPESNAPLPGPAQPQPQQ